MNQTVIGVFDTADQAKEAKQALENASFTNVDHRTFGEKGRYDDRYAKSTDSVYSFFSNLFDGDDEETINGYVDVARRGTVVTVYTETMDEAKRAAQILDQYGSVDFDERRQAYTGYENDLNEDTIKVIEENIAVGKREVTTGGATVRARVVSKPVTETLRLREEHITIDRKPVDRPATEADFTEGTITMTETAEEAVVGKEARVVEEISLNKEVNTRTETINETVRKTEVDVEETAGEIVKEYNSKTDINRK